MLDVQKLLFTRFNGFYTSYYQQIKCGDPDKLYCLFTSAA